MKIYLAGGMRSNWRERMIKECPNIEFLCPKSTFRSQDEWWTYDKVMINTCDVVLIYIEKGKWAPIGMVIEEGMAYGLGKPVILVNERYCDGIRREGESPEEQLARYLKCTESFCDILFTSLDQAIEYLKKW